jgi:hypothetical protein
MRWSRADYTLHVMMGLIHVYTFFFLAFYIVFFSLRGCGWIGMGEREAVSFRGVG